MKIDLFSPLPPARTEVGNFTARILPVLSRHCEVTVWTPQKQWEQSLEDYAAIRHIPEDKMPWSLLNRTDFVIYNMGNDAGFHSTIYKISQMHPGVVILHDLSLQEFFGENPPDTETDDSQLQHVQLTLKDACGAIIHNGNGFDKVAAATPAPVLFTPLPHCTRDDLLPLRSKKTFKDPNAPLSLICFGFLGGQNRRLRQILEAIASYPKRKTVRFDIYGQVAFLDELKSWITELNLLSLVTVHGFVSENELIAALDDAALCINLRYPTRGESSASLLRAWNHSLPSLVSRTNWFQTLPETCVAFVQPENEIEDIHKHLDTLLEHPEIFAAKGRAGREYLEKHHTVEDYVENLLEFLPEVARFRGTAFAKGFSRRVSQKLAREFDHPEAQKHLLDRTAREIASWL